MDPNGSVTQVDHYPHMFHDIDVHKPHPQAHHVHRFNHISHMIHDVLPLKDGIFSKNARISKNAGISKSTSHLPKMCRKQSSRAVLPSPSITSHKSIQIQKNKVLLDHLTAMKNAEREVDLKWVGLYPEVSPISFYDVCMAFAIATVHCIIPGGFRLIQGDNFAGDTFYEHIVTYLNIAICWPCVFVGCIYLREIAALYAAQAKALQKLADFTKPADARKAGLPCYLDLIEGNNIDAWLLVRKDILSDYAADPTRSQMTALLGPVLILDFILLIAIFIRVVVLKRQFDIFSVLSVYDMFVLDLYLLSIILFVIKCNDRSQRVHMVMLERERYRVGKLMFLTHGGESERTLKKVSTLLNSAINRVEKLASPVKILGLEVNDALLTHFLSLMAAGAASGLAKFVLL